MIAFAPFTNNRVFMLDAISPMLPRNERRLIKADIPEDESTSLIQQSWKEGINLQATKISTIRGASFVVFSLTVGRLFFSSLSSDEIIPTVLPRSATYFPFSAA